MAKKFTVLGYADQLQALVKDLNKTIQKPLGRGRTKIRRQLIDHYGSHHLGAIIWQWRKDRFGVSKTGPVVRTDRVRFSHSRGGYVTTVGVDGLAATIEQGGNLRRLTTHGQKRTPGVAVSRKSAFDRIVNGEWPRIVDFTSKEFNELVRRRL